MTEPMLSIRQVAVRLNVSTDSIRRWTKAGQFPLPITIGVRVVRWRASDIEAHTSVAQQPVPAQ